MNVDLQILIEVLKKGGVFLATDPFAHYFKPQALPLIYFAYLLLLGYMVLTQAMKGIYISKHGWQ